MGDRGATVIARGTGGPHMQRMAPQVLLVDDVALSVRREAEVAGRIDERPSVRVDIV